MIFKGNAALQGEHSALGIVYGEVRRQAGSIAFNRIFFIIGLAFLAIIPLLLLLRRPAQQTGSSTVP